MGALIAAMILTGRAIAPAAGLASLINAWSQARQARGNQPTTHREAEGQHQSEVRGQWQPEAVEVTYPDMAKPALAGVTLNIHPGERIGVLGRGGSGKTTWLAF